MKARQWLALVALFLTSLVSRSALAQHSVACLGVRSLDGDTALELQVSLALKAAASQFSEFSVKDGNVSLAQMSLAHGCEKTDEVCLSDIASTLESELLLFGTLTRVERGIKLSLYRFNAQNASVDAHTSRTFARARLSGEAGDSAVAALLTELVRGEALGRVEVNGPPGAAVSIDGELVGTIGDGGIFSSEQVHAGSHTLLLESRETGRRRAIPFSLAAGETKQLEVAFAPEAPQTGPRRPLDNEFPASKRERDSSRVRRGVGISLLGLSALTAGATGYAWVRINKIANDPDMRAYRSLFPRPDRPGGADDVCVNAKAGVAAANDPSQAGLEQKARSLCKEASTLETLQYVFLGSTLVTATVGAILLLKKPKRASKVTLSPLLNRQGAALEASFRF